MAQKVANASMTIDIPNDKLIIKDETDYIGQNSALDTTFYGQITSLKSPQGYTIYSNPVTEGVDPKDFDYSTNPSTDFKSFTTPKLPNGEIETGWYLLEIVIHGAGDTFQITKGFNFAGYDKVNPSIKFTVDCITPKFSAEDITDYSQPKLGDIEPVLVQSPTTLTLESPKSGEPNVVENSGLLETDRFFTTINTVSLVRTIYYEIDATELLYLIDEVEYEEEKNVVCVQDLCSLYEIVESLNKDYTNALKTNYTLALQELWPKWLRAMGLLTMVRQALICGNETALEDYSIEIEKLKGKCGVEVSVNPVLVQAWSATDNNTVSIAYGTDLVGTNFSLNAFNGYTHIAFFAHNKKYTPIVSDFVGLWTQIPTVVGGGGSIPVSTDGLRQIADDTEYTAGETIFNTINDSITFYYVEQTFTTAIPFNIDNDIAANNITKVIENVNFTAILNFLPFAQGGQLGTVDRIIYPKTITVKDPNSKKIYRAKQDALNDIPLTNETYWENIIEDDVIKESITQNLGVSVGGINDQETFAAGTSHTDLWKRLLTTIFYPTLIAPTFSLAKTANTLQKTGATVNFDLLFGFNRGSINGDLNGGIWNPALVQDFRAGAATSYTIDGVTQAGNTLSVSKLITIGNQSYSGTVTYDVGPQPLNSAGQNFETPLAGATSASQTTTIEGVYPLFATTTTITVATEQGLLSMITANNIQKTLVAESGGNKQFFDIPNDWLSSRPITKVEFFNTVSNSFDSTNQLSTFTQSATTHTIEGNVINYTRFTNNTSNRGSILIKIIF